jgi:hypothetical protein
MHNSCDRVEVEDTANLILRIKELDDIYRQAKNDAMKLRRKLEGRNVVILNNPSKSPKQDANYGVECGNFTVAQIEPQQKRGRGRPKKSKESIELIRGDVDDKHDDQIDYRTHMNKMDTGTFTGTFPIIDDDLSNAIYSIEDDEVYVKTKIGRFYDINTLQLKGWFNSYGKKNVWVY